MSSRRHLLKLSTELRLPLSRSLPHRVAPVLVRAYGKPTMLSRPRVLIVHGIAIPKVTHTVKYYGSKSFPPHNLIAMPALSPTMTQGGIGAWQKKVGDEIVPGDVLVEIETDKAQMDFECQEEGFVAKILVETGTKDVPVGQPIAVFVENESDVTAFEGFTAQDAGSAPKPAASTPPSGDQPEAKATDAAPSKPDATSSSSAAFGTSEEDRIKASPLAEKITNECGIDIDQIKGSESGETIVKDDVDSSKRAHASASTSSQTVPAQKVTVAPPPPAYAPQSATGDAFADISTSNMRRVIANRLSESKQQVPHYYVIVDINMNKVIKLRKALNDASDGKYKLSINDFIIKASALSLKKVPEVNSAWQNDFIRQYASADISIAVATPTGLITPIVTNAESRGLSDISNRVKDMANRARQGKLAPHEYQGGTFSISNLGMYGVQHFTAIINPPQSCILAVGGTTQKMVPDNTKASGFSVHNVMEVTLSSDHRVVDGAISATWLQAFKSYMENPLKMLL